MFIYAENLVFAWVVSTIFCLQVSFGLVALKMSAGSTFGQLFRVSTFGESHGKAVGVCLDGCPPRLPLSEEYIQTELDRRRPGQSRLTSRRTEPDVVRILSGVVNNITLGTPIMMMVLNEDQRSDHYDEMGNVYRPSHADATYLAKYGTRAVAGGGRASARETVARVAAGAVAKAILRLYSHVEVIGFVRQVQDITLDAVDYESLTVDMVERSMIRCPDSAVSQRMIERIDSIRRTGDSVGGVVEVIARNVPAGLGSPVFDKLEAQLAAACLSIPACRGFEVGSGFSGVLLTGREHNDEFVADSEGRVRTRTNRSGGIQGGISNGETLVIRAAFKPTATIAQQQHTVTVQGEETLLRGKGRHDPCVLSRAVPIVEAMVALVLVDALMQHTAQCGLFDFDMDKGAHLHTSARAQEQREPQIAPLGKKLRGAGRLVK